VIRVTRLRVRNYRGISALDAQIDGNGLIAKGRNGSGKTSVLNALGSALAAADIGPEAVRLGEADGEILVDLDAAGSALQVRRRFGPNGSTLSVTNDDGDRKSKPATYLADLLGTSPLDVIGVVLEKDKKKRRERILAALPVRVTVEQLRRWVPALPETYDTSGHGLEVIERLRSGAYAKRTEANKAEKAAAEELARKQAAAKAAAAEVPPGAGEHPAASEAAARAAADLESLRARRVAAEKTRERLAGMRTHAEKLRADAAEATEQAKDRPSEDEIAAAAKATNEAEAEVKRIEVLLVTARAIAATSAEACDELIDRARASDREAARAAELTTQAEQVEKSMEEAIDVVADEEIAAAETASTAAQAALEAAKKRVLAEAAQAALTSAEQAATAAKAEADRLDAVVRALSTEAPAAILAEAGDVAAGLELRDDEVYLKGVSLDRQCGADQMRFAADIARALHPKVGFLVVDGMERLDPEQLETFVAAATADGRQLFGSLVDRGDLVLAAVEHVAPAPAAAKGAA
jgi:hypothetical protein